MQVILRSVTQLRTMRLLICSGNPGKLAELRALLPPGFELLGLSDVGLPNDLPETGDTLEENALQKARAGFLHTGLPCVADDTGLEVDALGGAPGVRSARYAGEGRDPIANMELLLEVLAGVKERKARFKTLMAFVHPMGESLFEGVVQGTIAHAPRGTHGFGYDPIFIPDGYAETFAELELVAKNAISHRGRAVRKLVDHLIRE